MEAFAISSSSFGNDQQWGKFDAGVVGAIVDWIYDKNLEENLVTASEIVTNELIK